MKQTSKRFRFAVQDVDGRTALCNSNTAAAIFNAKAIGAARVVDLITGTVCWTNSDPGANQCRELALAQLEELMTLEQLRQMLVAMDIRPSVADTLTIDSRPNIGPNYRLQLDVEGEVVESFGRTKLVALHNLLAVSLPGYRVRQSMLASNITDARVRAEARDRSMPSEGQGDPVVDAAGGAMTLEQARELAATLWANGFAIEAPGVCIVGATVEKDATAWYGKPVPGIVRVLETRGTGLTWEAAFADAQRSAGDQAQA